MRERVHATQSCPSGLGPRLRPIDLKCRIDGGGEHSVVVVGLLGVVILFGSADRTHSYSYAIWNRGTPSVSYDSNVLSQVLVLNVLWSDSNATDTATGG